MVKKIYIINGMARCGKDTFADILGEYVRTYKYSSVTKIKDIAMRCGWIGGKTEKDRKFLSDLKNLTTAYSDLAFNDIKNVVNWFNNLSAYNVLLIDIREPLEIDRAKKEFGAETIFIENNRVPIITTNMADAGVFDYDYDYVIHNNGTIEEFRETIKNFMKGEIFN